MEKPARVEIGEKLYVTAFMVVIWSELVLTIVRNGLHFSWASVMIGACTLPVLLYLANWLFSGNRTAQLATLVVVVVQILLAILGLKLAPALAQLNEQVGPYCATIAVLRLLLYGGLAATLYSPRVQDFLNHQRGEHAEEKEELVLTPTGTTVALSGEQFEGVSALGRMVQIAAYVCIVAGLLQVASGAKGGTAGIFQAVEGVVLAVLGIFLLSPATGIRKLGVAGTDSAYLTHALGTLAMFFKRQLLLVLVVAVAVIAGIVLAVISEVSRWQLLYRNRPLNSMMSSATSSTALSRAMGLVSVSLLALAAIRVVSGVLHFKDGKFFAAIEVVEGVVTGLLGLVLLNSRDSAAFLAEAKGYEKTHFANLTSSLSVFSMVLIGFGVVVALASLLRLAL